MPSGRSSAIRAKGGRAEEPERGTFWRGTVIESGTRLRIARAIGKDEAEVARELMRQMKERGHPTAPPPLVTDGKHDFAAALVETWGQVPASAGRGRPPTVPRPGKEWQYLQVVKERSGGRMITVRTQVVYGDPATVERLLGHALRYVERTQLTMRQMNARLVRKTLSFSKRLTLLKAACAWEEAVYNLARPHESLRREAPTGKRRWSRRTPAMAAGLTDHCWTLPELVTTLVLHERLNIQ
jgi:transposase InsO family protein